MKTKKINYIRRKLKENGAFSVKNDPIGITGKFDMEIKVTHVGLYERMYVNSLLHKEINTSYLSLSEQELDRVINLIHQNEVKITYIS